MLAFAAEAELAQPTERPFILDPIVHPSPGQWVVYAADLRPGDVDASVHAEVRRAARRAERAAKEGAGVAQGLVGAGALPSASPVAEVGVAEAPRAAVVKKVARVHPKKPRD